MTIDPAGLAHLRHELRTPLNHIIGYSEMLLEDLAGGDRVELVVELRRIHEAGRRLVDLIGEVLAPSRVEAGTVDRDRLSGGMAPPLHEILDSSDRLKTRAGELGADGMLPDLDRIAAAAGHLVRLIAHGAGAPSAGRAGAAPADSRVALGGPAAGGRILVVDDNEENREMLRRRLARQGHEITAAGSGREALEAIHAQGADLVLLDVMMPGMDGYEVLQRLKAGPTTRDIPVLMISALDEIGSVVRCIELGADDYLTKPFDPVLLRARIDACLERKRLRDQEARHARELAEWNLTLEQRVREQVTQLERLGRLKRFFSPQVAELILAGGAEDPLRSHRRDVAVVFLDLRGYTAFSETVEPEEVMGVLREYHAAMGTLILAYEGTLERFAGDGMMIFFNDPVPVPDAAERAVRMAVAMRDRVGELAIRWRKRGYELHIGVGIAQGYATIGAIGFEGRWDYGAIGTVTNLAFRLCGEAKAGQILASQRVLATVEGVVEAEPVGELPLKGFRQPTPVYQVLRLKT